MRKQRKSKQAVRPQVLKLLRRAKFIANRYRRLTGRPLGITGEVAEVSAADALGLELAPVRQEGYDATRVNGRRVERLQIKGRCILDPKKSGGRLPKINLKKDWDAVLLVLLDADMELLEIYEAKRAAVRRALTKKGSKSRNSRGQLGIAQFKSVGALVWKRTSA